MTIHRQQTGVRDRAAARTSSVSGAGVTRIAPLTLVVCMALTPPGSAGSTAATADDRAQTIDLARTALEKWVDVRRTISKERADGRLRRETLDDRIALIEGEIAALRTRISEATAQVDETEGGRAALERENQMLRSTGQQLTEAVATLEGRTRSLLGRAPDPIRDKVSVLSTRMPDSGAETKLSLGERYQNVIGILNEVNRFNGEITARNEVRELSGGVSAEVSAVYLGLGHAFFVTTSGNSAGVGTATAERWTWTPVDDARVAISTVMAVLRNEQPASFVRVPVVIEGAPRRDAAPQIDAARIEVTP